jgi:hypothetical protein
MDKRQKGTFCLFACSVDDLRYHNFHRLHVIQNDRHYGEIAWFTADPRFHTLDIEKTSEYVSRERDIRCGELSLHRFFPMNVFFPIFSSVQAPARRPVE